MMSILLNRIKVAHTSQPIQFSGYGNCIAFGVFDGAKVEVELSSDGKNNWVELDVSFIKPGVQSFTLNHCFLRAVLGQAGVSTDITMELR